MYVDLPAGRCPTALFLAMVDRAEYLAALTAEFAQTLDPEIQQRLGPGNFLDLGAYLQLVAWESAGLTSHVDAGLPSADAAARQVAMRMRQGGATPESTLSNQVLGFLFTHCAWQGKEILSSDIALKMDAEDDALLDAIANLVWQNRHTASTTGDFRWDA